MNEQTIEELLSQVVNKGPEIFVVGDRQVLALPPEWTHRGLEEFLPAPKRITESRTFSDFASFCAYVNRFKSNDSWIDLDSNERGINATAYLDYHGKDSPSWNTHQVKYAAMHSDEYDVWSGKNGRYVTQSEFADFIYDNQEDISGMEGAALLEMVQQMKTTAKADCRDMRDNQGTVDMIFRMKVSASDATTDKPITFPKETTIAIPLYKGGNKVTFKIDFKMKIETNGDTGKAMFAFRIYRPDVAIMKHNKELSENLAKETKLPVWS